LKGDNIPNQGKDPYFLKWDVPDMPGYDHAYHVSGWRWDEGAIAQFGADLEKELATTSTAQGVQIVSTATNIDELKEEADNADKHYWCVARDTVFIYDNSFDIEDMMPSFVVCDDETQLKGEEPGAAAEANASGLWTALTHGDVVTIESPNNFVTNVKGLPADETEFNWHVTRWGCEDDTTVFVYRNVVKSDAIKDIYTCDNFAQLKGVNPQSTPQSPSIGTWTRTEGATTAIRFGDAATTPETERKLNSNKFDSWVFNLVQGANPLTWTVEKEMPPIIETTDEEGNVTKKRDKLFGHTYYIGNPCPDHTDVMVHNLKPDDAVIQTGKEITPSPSPGP
jgi:hypothetical protein